MNPEVRPIMSIREVSIGRSLEQYEYHEGLLDAGLIQPILTLPSLEKLNLENVWGADWLSDAPPKPSRYSNLKALNLCGCNVTAEIVEGFCSGKIYRQILQQQKLLLTETAAIALESLICERQPICQPMRPETDPLFVLIRAVSLCMKLLQYGNFLSNVD